MKKLNLFLRGFPRTHDTNDIVRTLRVHDHDDSSLDWTDCNKAILVVGMLFIVDLQKVNAAGEQLAREE